MTTTPTVAEFKSSLVPGRAQLVEDGLFWSILAEGYQVKDGRAVFERFKADTGLSVDISNHGLNISVLRRN